MTMETSMLRKENGKEGVLTWAQEGKVFRKAGSDRGL